MTDDDSIPLFEITWDERDVEYATDSITRGSYWAKGPYVTEFEEQIADYIGTDHAIVVNSGTTALVASLLANGIGPADEVLVPSFTFIATANAVALTGAEPVFVDIERETYGLDPDAVTDAITERTEAILPVHPYGGACKITELASVASDHDLVLIEDAAEVFGADIDGERLGSIGTAGVLSFCQNKIIATGEGGAIVTDDSDVAEAARLYRSHGRQSSSYFESAHTGEYVTVGTNIRMPDVVAAIGCAQIEKVEELIEGRRRAAGRMTEAFEEYPAIEPHTGPEHGRHVYQLYSVTLDPEVDRNSLIQSLADQNIASKVYWDPPVHRTACFRNERVELPVTEEIATRVLSLPIHPSLTPSECDRIVDAVISGIDDQLDT